MSSDRDHWQILIVDDEIDLTELADELLTARGHTVMTADNGQRALATLDHVHPDAILLDVMMPVMSGVEMLQVLKMTEAYRDIPVILMSAAGREVVPDELRECVAGFLQKPFAFDELTHTLDVALANRT